MSRKSFLLLSCVLSLAMIAPAQQGGGGGGGGRGGGGGNTGGNTGGGGRGQGGQGGQGGNQGGSGNQRNDPFGRQNDPFGQQRRQQQRPVFLSGAVLLDDGNPPPESVTIRRVCNGRNVPETYTDRKGRFSFQLGGDMSLAMSDASSAGVPGGRGGAFGGQQGGLGGFGAGNSTGMGQVDLSGCELVAELPGYRSDRLQLGRRSVFDNPDVGVIILHRLGGVKGDAVSVTTLAAPKNAQKAYERAAKELRKKDASKRNPGKAVKDLERAVAEYPKYAAAWTLLGQTKMNMNDPDGAREAFQMAMKADAKYMKPYAPLLQLELQEGNWDQVSEISATLLKLNPNITDVKYYQSVASYNLGNFDEAEKAIEAVHSSQDASRFPQTYQIMGLIHSKKGDFAKAATSYRSFVEAQPGSPAATKVKRQLMEWQALGVISKADAAVAAN